MDSQRRTRLTALITVPLLVTVLLTAFGGLGYLIASVLGIPHRLDFPYVLRLCGLLFLGTGFTILVWLFRHRSPLDIMVSTFVEITKNFHRASPQDQPRRAEPLVVTGPQRYIRHPLYSGAILLGFGWWLFLDYTFLLFVAVFLLLWFNFVVAPFEEKELKSLFGPEYESYMRETPRFLPSFRRLMKPDAD